MPCRADVKIRAPWCPLVDQPLHILPRRCRQLAPLGQYCLEDRRTRRVLRIPLRPIHGNFHHRVPTDVRRPVGFPRQQPCPDKVHAVLLSLPFNQIQPRVTNVLPKIRSADPIPCPSTPARHAARIHCRRDRSANRSLAPPESVSNGRWVNLPAFPAGFPTHTSTICCRRDRSTNQPIAIRSAVVRPQADPSLARATLARHRSTTRCPDDHATSRILVLSTPGPSVRQANPLRAQVIRARHTPTIHFPHACSTNRTLAPSMPRQSFQREDHLLLPATPARQTPTIRCRRGRSTSHTSRHQRRRRLPSRQIRLSCKQCSPDIRPRFVIFTRVQPIAPSRHQCRQSFQREDHLLLPATPARQTPTIRCRRGRSTSRSLSPSTPPSTAQQANPPFVQAMLARHTSTIRYLHDRSASHSLSPSVRRPPVRGQIPPRASNARQTNVHDSLSLSACSSSHVMPRRSKSASVTDSGVRSNASCQTCAQ